MHSKIGLIGHNISYTLSPLIHNTAFKLCDLPYSYVSLDVSPEQLSKTLENMQSQNFIGANVTIPYKETILKQVTSLSETARIIGAVNTILFRSGKIVGDNTDADGFLAAYKEDLHLLKNESILIIGAGGASRAILYALLTSIFPSDIFITNRTSHNTTSVIKWVKEKFSFTDITACEWQSPEVKSLSETVGGIIQTTPLGSVNYPNNIPLPHLFILSRKHIVIDIIYQPLQTPLLEKAKESGARTRNGLPMLIQQAARSFFLWTGKEFPENQIQKVLLNHFKNSKTNVGTKNLK